MCRLSLTHSAYQTKRLYLFANVDVTRYSDPPPLLTIQLRQDEGL